MRRVICFVVMFILISTFTYAEQPAWNCPNCGKTDNHGNFCGACGNPAVTVDEKIFLLGFDMTEDEVVSSAKQLFDIAQTWNKQIVPKTIEEFPLWPIKMKEIYNELLSASSSLDFSENGISWTTNVTEILPNIPGNLPKTKNETVFISNLDTYDTMEMKMLNESTYVMTIPSKQWKRGNNFGVTAQYDYCDSQMSYSIAFGLSPASRSVYFTIKIGHKTIIWGTYLDEHAYGVYVMEEGAERPVICDLFYDLETGVLTRADTRQ